MSAAFPPSINSHQPYLDHNNDPCVLNKNSITMDFSSTLTHKRKPPSPQPKGIRAKKHKKDTQGKKPPTGYIHVRARRGQATDSHSLAERVRREKISERMKMLQSLVPGCDKVTGKALMLDEIINYVQSLQYQIEFLSMKLASVNPMLYDFGVDMESLMVMPDQKFSSPFQETMQECSPIPEQSCTFGDRWIDTRAHTNNSFILQQQSQIPYYFSHNEQKITNGGAGINNNSLFSFP